MLATITAEQATFERAQPIDLAQSLRQDAQRLTRFCRGGRIPHVRVYGSTSTTAAGIVAMARGKCPALLFLLLISLGIRVEAQQRIVVKLRTPERIFEESVWGPDSSLAATASASLVKSPPADDPTLRPRLSLPLIATAGCNGTLVGYSEEGDPIIDVPEMASEVLAKSGIVSSVEFDVPKKFEEVKELVLIYKLSDQPTAQELKAAGVEMIKQRKRKDYGYMRVKPLGGGIGLPAALLQKLLAVEGLIEADANHSIVVEAPLVTIRRIEEGSGAAAEKPPTNDLRWTELWGMRSIRAPMAWAISPIDGPEVIVAVVDTGIDATHADLKDNLWRNTDGTVGFNAITRNNDPIDNHGHGTHCAGIIAAAADNSEGVVGVGRKVKVMALKFLQGKPGEPARGDLTDAADCIDFAVQNKARIINCSWGSYNDNFLLKREFQAAQDNGVLVVAAAGNGDAQHRGLDNDKTPYYPASYSIPNIISVGAVDHSDRLTSFSNFGKKSVHIAAPGFEILSCYPAAIDPALPPYRYMNGTSMAAPHVAGALALMLKHPEYSQRRVLQELVGHARNAGLSVSSQGVLDLSFLNDKPPRQPRQTRTAIKKSQFSFRENKSMQPGKTAKLAEITIEVKEPVTILISANTSARIQRDAQEAFAHMIFGFSREFPINDPEGSTWGEESLRPVTINQAETWVNFGSIYVVDISSPGTHTFYWYGVHREGGAVGFGSGAMVVETAAMPPSSP